MANNRIAGITIEIDGNTTPLQKALQGINKDLKDTQSSLKDVDKLLKMDPGNITLLKQKQDLLKKAIEDKKPRSTKRKKLSLSLKQRTRRRKSRSRPKRLNGRLSLMNRLSKASRAKCGNSAL